MRALDGLRLRNVLVAIPHLRILRVRDMFFATRGKGRFLLLHEKRTKGRKRFLV
jgi:hypothetical protein